MYQYFFIQIIFYLSILFIHVSWWTFGLLYILAIVISAAMNIHIEVFILTPVLSSFEYTPRNGLGHVVSLCLIY